MHQLYRNERNRASGSWFSFLSVWMHLWVCVCECIVYIHFCCTVFDLVVYMLHRCFRNNTRAGFCAVPNSCKCIRDTNNTATHHLNSANVLNFGILLNTIGFYIFANCAFTENKANRFYAFACLLIVPFRWQILPIHGFSHIFFFYALLEMIDIAGGGFLLIFTILDSRTGRVLCLAYTTDMGHSFWEHDPFMTLSMPNSSLFLCWFSSLIFCKITFDWWKYFVKHVKERRLTKWGWND